jgi:hypothetical protein
VKQIWYACSIQVKASNREWLRIDANTNKINLTADKRRCPQMGFRTLFA